MTVQPLDSETYQTLTARLKRVSVAMTVVLGGVILLATLSPSVPDVASRINDKVLHAVAFAGLVLPCAIFLARHLIWTVPIALLFGAAIELLQPNFGRTASFADFLADAGGLAIGVAVGLVLRSWIKSYVSRSKPVAQT